MTWKRSALLSSSVLPLASISVSAANLPYNPTRILLSQQNDASYAYIFQPGSDSTTSAQFSSINLANDLDASNITLTTLSSSLPFLSSSKSTAFTPFVDSSANITVLAGDCSKGASGAQLWRFQPDTKAKHGNGTWFKDTLLPQNLGSGNDIAGSNYLSQAIAFSEIVGGNVSDTNIYAFGGMCPNGSASTDTWTSSANYSNLMVTMTPEEATAADLDYQLALVSSRGPPIAEAGFSMTALSSSFSNTSAGIQNQQQNFVLLGGHTKSAFINMSQVALFSLPQESWAFLPVKQPSGSKTDLSRRDGSTQVEPRSGHTAVLSPDGKSIVVYGGWVGDVNTPATPQLAVLQLGSGYGGTGGWYWTVPTSSGSATLSSAGIYGHGAAMLPGGVMMVMGGYTISATSKRFLRRASTAQNTQTLFYNLTSSTWITSYSSSASGLFASSDTTNKGRLATTSQKAGLGVGVAVAILLLVGLIIFYVWYMRKLRQRRRGQESATLSLVGEKRSFDDTWLCKSSFDGHEGDIPIGHTYGEREPHKEAFPWLPEIGDASWKRKSSNGREVERTGVCVNIPSPTRGLRRGSGSRAYQYQAAPKSEEARISRASTGIHPIEEEDERQSMLNGTSRPSTADAQRRLRAVEQIFDDDAKLKAVERALADDPFQDPEPNPLGSHPVSPDMNNLDRRFTVDAGRISPSKYGHKSISVDKDQIAGWVNEWSAPRDSVNDPIARLSGRTSPDKSSDERTSSSLSEQSARSYQSARSNRSMARTTSTRSNAFFGMAGAPYISPQQSPTEERTFNIPVSERLPPMQMRSGVRSVTAPAARPDSLPSVNATFVQLQAEGEALLGASADPYRQAVASHNRTRSSQYSQATEFAPASHEGNNTSSLPSRRRLGWMGSIRRALGTPTSGHRDLDEQSSLDRTTTPSPTKSDRIDEAIGSGGRPPRRRASESSTFLRTKRGKDDWTLSGGEKGAWEPYRDEPDTGDWGIVNDSSSPSAAAPQRMHSQSQGGAGLPRSLMAGVPPPVNGSRGGDGGAIGLEDDWDVEKAAEGRDVQVMFTVPKARLRVVNADVDRASLRSVSEGSKSLSELQQQQQQHGGLKKQDSRNEGRLVDVEEGAEKKEA